MKRKVLLLMILVLLCGIGYFYYDSLVPHISLIDEDITVNVGEDYKDPGVKAYIGGKDLSEYISTEKISTDTLGDYSQIYTLSYNGSSITKSRTIHIVDTVSPTIILGGEKVEWSLNTPFNDLAVRVYDNYDKDISYTVSNNVDVSKEGTYEETYEAIDSSGNKTSIKRQIIVSKDAKVNTGVSVCMYHYLYEKGNIPDNVGNNHMCVDTLNEEIDYLLENHYYFPTYEELRDYVDKKKDLPGKSIILTFDDGVTDTLKLLKKVSLDKKVPITSFLITSKNGKKKRKTYETPYLQFESHTDNMHHGGGNIGHGGIMTALSVKEAVKDLKTSIKICGHGDALAYPYGDTNSTSVQAVKESGFLVAFTTQFGQSQRGDDPYLLPRVRMTNNQSLETFKKYVE